MNPESNAVISVLASNAESLSRSLRAMHSANIIASPTLDDALAYCRKHGDRALLKFSVVTTDGQTLSNLPAAVQAVCSFLLTYPAYLDVISRLPDDQTIQSLGGTTLCAALLDNQDTVLDQLSSIVHKPALECGCGCGDTL